MNKNQAIWLTQFDTAMESAQTEYDDFSYDWIDERIALAEKLRDQLNSLLATVKQGGIKE